MATFERQTFEVSRELEYFSTGELEMQIGHGRDWWPVAIFKELVDNALDACEIAGASPRMESVGIADEMSEPEARALDEVEQLLLELLPDAEDEA